jgi:hypothetical protein
VVEDWKVMDEAVSSKGREHPGVIQDEEMLKDPKMKELKMF